MIYTSAYGAPDTPPEIDPFDIEEDEEDTCDSCGYLESDCDCEFCDDCGLSTSECECEDEDA